MTYSILDLTLPVELTTYNQRKEIPVGLDRYAFWQAIANLSASFKQNHMGYNSNRNGGHGILVCDMSLVFAEWVSDVKFIRYRDQVISLFGTNSNSPHLAGNYVRLTLDILMSEFPAIQKLVLLDSLWQGVYGPLGGLKPVLNRTTIVGFTPYQPIKLTMDEILEKVGTAAFAKDEPGLSSLFATYKMINPLIAKKHPELIESVDIGLSQIISSESLLASYQVVVELLDKIKPLRAKNSDSSVKTIYKLDCDCHLDDYHLATEMIKFILSSLYTIHI